MLWLILALLGFRGVFAESRGGAAVEPIGHNLAKEPYLVDAWGRGAGLPQSSVLAVVQDAVGYLWLATQTGVVRFDGRAFEVFDHLSHPVIRDSYTEDLVAAPAGGLWIATHDGLIRWREGEARRFGVEDGLVDDTVQTLHLGAGGRLWIGTAKGLSVLEGDHFDSWTTADGLVNDSIWALEEDPEGGLWIGSEAGSSYWTGQHFEHHEMVADSRGRQVYALHIDRSGTLWVGSVAGIRRREGDRFTTPEDLDGLVRGAVRAIFEDTDGTLWIGGEGGLIRRSASGGTAVLYTVADGLPDQEIRSIWRDHEGSLWVGTNSGGLARLRPNKFHHMGRSEGLVDDFVWSIFEDRQHVLWVGTNTGSSRVEPSGAISSWALGDAVRTFFEDRSGRFWIGTLQGLFEWADGRPVPRLNASDLPFPRVNCMTQTQDGALWIGTEGGGVYRLDDSATITHRLTAAEGLPHEKVRDLVADPQGGLWIATQDGLAHWNDGALTVWTTDDGLSDDYLLALFLDPDGSLWIGTAAGGLNLLRDDRVVSFTRRDGMVDNLVLAIIDDGLGYFWLTSNSGLIRVARNELESLARGADIRLRPVTYGEQDGLRSGEMNGGSQPAGWALDDGRLAFPTLAGVALIDPSRADRAGTPPPVHLEEILVDGALEDPAGPLDVESGVKDLELRWVALSFLDPERIRYRYRLLGFEGDWVEAEGRRFAHYTHLPPGDYRFEVIAANSHGVWNREGAHLELRVHPAFHQTWSFYLLAALGLVVTGHLVHRFLVRRLLDHNRDLRRIQRQLEAKNEEVLDKNLELERFAYAVSHDLKSPLFTIEGFLGLVERDAEKGDMERLREDMGRIWRATGTMRRLLDELLDLSRVGRKESPSEPIDLTELAREAAELVAGRIAERGVEVDIQSPMPVVLGVRNRLLQVFQNLVDNAVKFMGDQPKPRLEIRAAVSGPPQTGGVEQVEIRIHDNGQGIEPRHQEKIFGLFDQLDVDAEGTGIGLALARRILEFHGGTIRVESAGKGKGATFVFTLPGAEDRAHPWLIDPGATGPRAGAAAKEGAAQPPLTNRAR